MQDSVSAKSRALITRGKAERISSMCFSHGYQMNKLESKKKSSNCIIVKIDGVGLNILQHEKVWDYTAI